MSNTKKQAVFENRSPHADPAYAHATDSGFDLRAWIPEGSITLKPLERRLVHTGLYFEVPVDTEIQVRPRSGMALKRGLSVCNTPGTVDEGYRGEIGIIAINLSNDEITIVDGERIAQGVICPVFNGAKVDVVRTEHINEDATERKAGGFGSTSSI